MTAPNLEFRPFELLLKTYRKMQAEGLPEEHAIPSFVTLGAILAHKTGGQDGLRQAVSAMAMWHQKARIGEFPGEGGKPFPNGWRETGDAPKCVSCQRAIQESLSKVDTGLCDGCVEIVLLSMEIQVALHQAYPEMYDDPNGRPKHA